MSHEKNFLSEYRFLFVIGSMAGFFIFAWIMHDLLTNRIVGHDYAYIFRNSLAFSLLLVIWMMMIICVFSNSLKTALFRILSVLISSLFVLLCAEISLRVLYARDVSIRNLDNTFIPHDIEKNYELGDLIRMSTDNRIIYELKPNMVCKYKEKLLITNDAGFRCEHPLGEKQEDELRILGLGDSHMFGFGVSNGSTYMFLLEKLLEDQLGRPVTSINTAVPGYNTSMEEQVLLKKGLAFNPDIVILGWCKNDFYLPNFIMNRRSVFSPDFFIDDFFKTRIEWKMNKRIFKDRHWAKLEYAWRNEKEMYQLMADIRQNRLETIPEDYHGLIGTAAVYKGLQNIKAVLEERKIAFIVLVIATSPGDDDDWIRTTCQELQIPVCDTMPVFQNYWADHGSESTNYIPGIDHHYNETGHRLVAGILKNFILRTCFSGNQKVLLSD